MSPWFTPSPPGTRPANWFNYFFFLNSEFLRAVVIFKHNMIESSGLDARFPDLTYAPFAVAFEPDSHSAFFFFKRSIKHFFPQRLFIILPLSPRPPSLSLSLFPPFAFYYFQKKKKKCVTNGPSCCGTCLQLVKAQSNLVTVVEVEVRPSSLAPAAVAGWRPAWCCCSPP